MKTEILDFIEYKYEKISIIAESDDKSITLLKDKETGEYCRLKSINRVVDVYKQLKSIKSEYLPEIFYLHYDENETNVIVEEIQGRTLQSYIDEGKRFSAKETESIFLQLCNALAVLHKHGIIHRDLKPDNIMYADGKVKLVDFDAAREVSDDKKEQLNDTVMLGTKGFAPPEQYGFEQTDERADIYAMGVTMKLIAGSSRKYKKILSKCVGFAPKERYKSTSAVKRAIYLRKYRGLIRFAAILLLILWFGINSYYNDPVFRDDVLLLLQDGGFITLTEEQQNRIFAKQNFDEEDIKNIWCGKYKNSDNAELEIKYKNGLEFTIITYQDGIKTSKGGGELTLENKETAVFSTTTPAGKEYRLYMNIYENGIIVTENEVSSPYSHGQSMSGYYKKIK